MTHYKVGEVARITRVSVRTLHHWDEIGLVAPSGRSAKGYRLYTDDDLDRLQQVLFYRELGMRLDDVAATLADPAFDRRRALVAHRAALLARVEHARALLDLVDRTLGAMEGEADMKPMTPEAKFEAFGEFDPDAHADEAKARWGETSAYAESRRRTRAYTPEQWSAMRAEAAEVERAFAELMASGADASEAAALALAERHRLHIDRWFYPCSPAMHAELGRMYVDDPRFAAHYESVAPGLACYVRDAIVANERRRPPSSGRYS